MSGHTLGDVARAIGAELEGLAERAVGGMAPLEDAGPNDLCFAASEKMLEAVMASQAAGVIVGEGFPPLPSHNLLRVPDAKAGFVRALELFVAQQRRGDVHPSAAVADDVQLGEGVGVGPLVVIESGVKIGARTQVRAGAFIGNNSAIGADCDIGVNVVLQHGTRLGDRCLLHAGAVLGSDGYGYAWQGDHHHKIPQIGIVVLEDDVEIGANACIDRATVGETRIGRGSKIDNLVQIAHNNRIGAHVLLTAQVGIAGSCRIGNGVVMGGQVGVADHVSIGDGVQIGAQGGVISDIAAGSTVWGLPAKPKGQVLREMAALGRLPDLNRQVRSQQQELDALRERLARLEASVVR